MIKAYETSIEVWVRKSLKDAKASGKRLEQGIEGREGLFLVVEPSGKVWWLGRYQLGRGDARQRKRTSIGRYGEGGLTLAQATEALAKFAAAAERGTDLLTEQKTKAKSDAFTLRKVFEERLSRDSGTAARTLADYETVLAKHVFPVLGDKPASGITPQEFAMLMLRMEKGDKNTGEKGSKHRTHKIRSALGSTYRWAQRNYPMEVPVNPVAGLAFTHQSERRRRVLSDDEMGRLWNAARTYAGLYAATRDIVRLAVLTGQRNSECAGMELAELKGLDTATPRWDIPARRMKRKSDDQHVPLPVQAVAIVKAQLATLDKGAVHVFPGTTHGRRIGQSWKGEYMGQDTVSHAFARIAKAAKVENIRLHDMRKCITSWLAENGHATPEVLDAILHHRRGGVTGSHYNFALYEGQVRKALQLWADHVDAISRGAHHDASNVVALRG